jgi:hypothetical protein
VRAFFWIFKRDYPVSGSFTCRDPFPGHSRRAKGLRCCFSDRRFALLGLRSICSETAGCTNQNLYKPTFVQPNTHNNRTLNSSRHRRENHGSETAVAAHMEIASPSIAEAIAKCAADGFGKVVVAPYFLSQGRHIQQDIPALVAEALTQHPGLECVIADPIGTSPD